MHFAQTRNCRERKNQRGQPCKCQRRHTRAREPVPTQVSAWWSEPWHTSNTVAPCQAAPFTAPAEPAVPPEAHTFPDSHYLYLSLPDSGRSGTHTEPFTSLLLCPVLPTRAGWAALLLLFSHPARPWPAQWEGEEPRPAALSQVRVSNQPLFSFQKLSLWSWARDTHLDTRCDGGQGFQGDL